jgi:uncharacterized protein Usg
MMHACSSFEKQLGGYGMTTVKILYRLPDYRSLVQEFIWQQYDMFPEFPELKKFLAFWEEQIEGPLYKVTIAHQRLIKPAEFKNAIGEYVIH